MHDAIIIGGGPAGLSLASELARSCSVLVIERGRVGETTKAWTTSRAIAKRAGVEKHIAVEFPIAYLECLGKNRTYAHADYVSFDEKSILSHWKEKAEKRGAAIEERCEFLSMERKKNGVSVKTSGGTFPCKLLIDCSGAWSKIAQELDIFERVFYWPVYGEVFEGAQLKDTEVIAGSIVLDKNPPTWFEVFPVSGTQCVAYTFQYLGTPLQPEKLKGLYEKQFKMIFPESEARFKDVKRVRIVKGLIPMGIPKKQAADSVFFFGDTSLLAPSFAGTGFTNILLHHKEIARHLAMCIEEGTLDEESLEYDYTDLERFNRNIQIVFGMLLLHADIEQLAEIFEGFKALPNRTLVRFVLQELTPADCVEIAQMLVMHVNLERIARILPETEYVFAAQTLGDLLGDTVLYEADQVLRAFF